MDELGEKMQKLIQLQIKEQSENTSMFDALNACITEISEQTSHEFE